jgi:hypothetical protein
MAEEEGIPAEKTTSRRTATVLPIIVLLALLSAMIATFGVLEQLYPSLNGLSSVPISAIGAVSSNSGAGSPIILERFAIFNQLERRHWIAIIISVLIVVAVATVAILVAKDARHQQGPVEEQNRLMLGTDLDHREQGDPQSNTIPLSILTDPSKLTALSVIFALILLSAVGTTLRVYNEDPTATLRKMHLGTKAAVLAIWTLSGEGLMHLIRLLITRPIAYVALVYNCDNWRFKSGYQILHFVFTILFLPLFTLIAVLRTVTSCLVFIILSPFGLYFDSFWTIVSKPISQMDDCFKHFSLMYAEYEQPV